MFAFAPVTALPIPSPRISLLTRPKLPLFPLPRNRPKYIRPIVSATSTSTSTSASASASASTTPATSASVSTATTPVSRLRIRTINTHPTEYINTTLTVSGWVRSVRSQKAFSFIDLNDGSSLSGLQIIVPADIPSYETVTALTTGCSVSATGTLVESQGKGQNIEMQATAVELLGDAVDYPLQKKRHTLEFLRGIAHLRPRTNAIGGVMRVRSCLIRAVHDYYAKLGFVCVNTPIITASDCEGAGEMFHITATDQSATSSSDEEDNKPFFGKDAFLTVSGQLCAETYACALGDVYTFGPTFRAENSNTSRHLAEFWMVEPEMAFCGLREDMDNAEGLVQYVVKSAMSECEEELRFFDKFIQKGLWEMLETVIEKPFARVSYTEAIDILTKANKKNKKGKTRFEYDVSWGVDLQSEHERYLAEEHFSAPVFVYNYPKAIKAFYMRDNDEDGGKTVEAMDLLVPGIGELIGGSAREHRLDILEKKIEENGLDKEAYWWYLDLRRFGSVPHAGYGLGFERLVQFVTGMDNIRDVIPFPRYPGSAEF